MIICQITRGVCPARSVAFALGIARDIDLSYYLFEGRPAVLQKNSAAAIAKNENASLLLIEDDAYSADPGLLERLRELKSDQAAYCWAFMRNGKVNVMQSKEGKFLYTGNIFTYIGIDVLRQIADPVFEPYEYTLQPDGSMKRMRLNKQGKHSDVDFWQKVRATGCEIVNLGQVAHLRHPFNEKQNFENCVEIREW